jgi:hypothetical protein
MKLLPNYISILSKFRISKLSISFNPNMTHYGKDMFGKTFFHGIGNSWVWIPTILVDGFPAAIPQRVGKKYSD